MEAMPYTITHLMIDYIVRYEVALNKLKSLPLPLQVQEELYEKSVIEEFEKVGELLGLPLGYYEAERVYKGMVSQGKKSKYLIFNNYRSAKEFIRNYDKSSSLKVSIELLTHINKILTKNSVEEWERGKFRAFGDMPNEVYDNWYQLKNHYPNFNMLSYFNEQIKEILSLNNRRNKLINIIILLFEFIDKAPLYAGNQLSSILFTELLINYFDMGVNKLFSPLKAINFISSDLETAFKISRENRDMTTFLEAALYTFSLEMVQIDNRYTKSFETKVKKHGKLQEKFNIRQIKLLEHLEFAAKVSRQEYRKMMGISFMTAFRDLQHLVKEGYLKTEGTGRGTIYKPIRKEEQVGDDKRRLEIFSDF